MLLPRGGVQRAPNVRFGSQADARGILNECPVSVVTAAAGKVLNWRKLARKPTSPPRLDGSSGCCQSNASLSPADAAMAEGAIPQTMTICHSASAAERRSL